MGPSAAPPDRLPARLALGRAFYAVPVETLTFLFTDIEGSTALLRRLGEDACAQVLEMHSLRCSSHRRPVAAVGLRALADAAAGRPEQVEALKRLAAFSPAQ